MTVQELFELLPECDLTREVIVSDEQCQRFRLIGLYIPADREEAIELDVEPERA